MNRVFIHATFPADLRFRSKAEPSQSSASAYHHMVLKVTLTRLQVEFLTYQSLLYLLDTHLAAAFTLEPIVILLSQLYFVMYYFVNVLLQL